MNRLNNFKNRKCSKQMMKGYFKCRNCRHLLDLSTDSVSTNHNVLLNDLNIQLDNTDHPQFNETTNGNQICEDNHYFLIDSKLNEIKWISEQLDKFEWTKGKINCPNNCGAKIGTFNFLNCLKCNCGKATVQSVHLIKSRIDFHVN